MSVLVACRGLRATLQEIEFMPVLKISPSAAYEEALAYWGVKELDAWVAVPTWETVTWDDVVRDASDSRVGFLRFQGAVRLLAASSDEAAIWYSGFPDEIPVTSDPNEFANMATGQIAEGDLEPAARFIRKPPA